MITPKSYAAQTYVSQLGNAQRAGHVATLLSGVVGMMNREDMMRRYTSTNRRYRERLAFSPVFPNALGRVPQLCWIHDWLMSHACSFRLHSACSKA
ncbi:hypothetical protein FOMPIDRAFT_89587 [Fomitopsis schrenkii]|uniref:Uncharacterized protein n=1 Tax=Fomitopsis schrenkii TaxID=2126942 RepID=S8DLQ8_FOMSC|nr:hypothetical protein FOMPIDRAFT_89587 [Fomitopsis schrenkii]